MNFFHETLFFFFSFFFLSSHLLRPPVSPPRYRPLQCLRLYIHEINRTFSDRLNDEPDLEKFRNILSSCYEKAFKEVKGLTTG